MASVSIRVNQIVYTRLQVIKHTLERERNKPVPMSEIIAYLLDSLR